METEERQATYDAIMSSINEGVAATVNRIAEFTTKEYHVEAVVVVAKQKSYLTFTDETGDNILTVTYNTEDISRPIFERMDVAKLGYQVSFLMNALLHEEVKRDLFQAFAMQYNVNRLI